MELTILHLRRIGQWEGAGNGSEFSGNSVTRAWLWIWFLGGTEAWLDRNHQFNSIIIFSSLNFLTFTNHIRKVSRGLQTCLKLFNGRIDHLLGCGLCVAADIWPLQQFFDVAWSTDEDDKVDAIHSKGYALAHVGSILAAFFQFPGGCSGCSGYIYDCKVHTCAIR